MAIKKYKYMNAQIDKKLYDKIMGLKTPKKSFRQASKDFADDVELTKWKYLNLKRKHK